MIDTNLNSQQMSPIESRSTFISIRVEHTSEPTPIKIVPSNGRFFSGIETEFK